MISVRILIRRQSGRVEPAAQEEGGDPEHRDGQRRGHASDGHDHADVEPDQGEHARLDGLLDRAGIGSRSARASARLTTRATSRRTSRPSERRRSAASVRGAGNRRG